jgi:hypothetical protein
MFSAPKNIPAKQAKRTPVNDSLRLREAERRLRRAQPVELDPPDRAIVYPDTGDAAK